MPKNQMYNLEGWLRDVRYALSVAGDDRAVTFISHLQDLLEEVLDGVFRHEGVESDGDDSDGQDLESEDGHDDVADIGPGDSSDPGQGVLRPGPGRRRLVGGPAAVADPVPRDVQEKGRGRSRSAAPVARTGKRVKRGTK